MLSSANHQTRQLGDSNDENAIHMYIARAGEIVACVRVHAGVIPEKLAAPLDLHRFSGCGQGHDCFISKLMIRRDHRGSMTAARLMRAMYSLLVELDVETVFCTTFPHLVDLYRRIGLEPYSDMYQDPDFGPHFAMAHRLGNFALQSSNTPNMPRAFCFLSLNRQITLGAAA
jgi:predicted GNAT family N-acyltransferase